MTMAATDSYSAFAAGGDSDSVGRDRGDKLPFSLNVSFLIMRTHIPVLVLPPNP